MPLMNVLLKLLQIIIPIKICIGTIYTIDTHRGKSVSEDIQDHLLNLNLGTMSRKNPLSNWYVCNNHPKLWCWRKHSQWLYRNFEKKNRYSLDSGNWYTLSYVIESPLISAEPLSTLPKNHATVLQDTVELKFQRPHSGKMCQIKHTQLPISSGFAITAHKSQGQSIKKAVIDLQNCRGTEAPLMSWYLELRLWKGYWFFVHSIMPRFHVDNQKTLEKNSGGLKIYGWKQ